MAAAAVAVAAMKRRCGKPMMPQHSVTAVRPHGTNRQTTMICIPNRSGERSAQARRRAPFCLRRI
jgi:hypothetical protein